MAAPKAQPELPRAVLVAALNALSGDKREAFMEGLTPDFVAIDAGQRMDGAALWKSVQSLRRRGVDPYWSVQDFVSHQQGNTVWADYRNIGGFVQQGRRKSKVWLESVVFTRGHDRWRIALLHSSAVVAH